MVLYRTVVVNERDINKKNISDILVKISSDNQLVTELHELVGESLDYGLDEIAFFDEILNPDKYASKTRSSNNLSNRLSNLLQLSNNSPLRGAKNDVFSMNNLEIYWPYSEDWDGISTPVVTFVPSNIEGIDNDDEYNQNYIVTAYQFIYNEEGEFTIDSLLVDENYAMNNPVWVVRNQSINIEDVIDLKKNKNFSKIIPRNKNLIINNEPEVRSTAPYKIAETRVASIKSEKQHDDWLNGGSEYHIYWFFPVKDFGLSTHKSGEIHFSRKEIKNKTTKQINFLGNFDWDKGQSHNRLKILEYDPGKDMQFNIKLSASFTPKESPVTVAGEFSTTIKINNNDDHILEYTIPRTSMFTTQTKINDKTYQKAFSGNGVTVNVKIYGIDGLEF